MVAGSLVPGGKCRIHLKDMVQATRLGDANGLAMPVSPLVRDDFDWLVEQGRGELGHSALHLLLAETFRASGEDVVVR